jgi:hypothetical protein
MFIQTHLCFTYTGTCFGQRLTVFKNKFKNAKYGTPYFCFVGPRNFFKIKILNIAFGL